jgi:hypothetical protein
MRPLSTALPLPARAWRRIAVLAAALVVLIATPAVAAGPGGYGISPVRAPFAVLTTNQLVPPGGGFNQLYYLSTSGTTGRTRLPFPLTVYNQTYRNIAISSNANVQFGVVSPNGVPDTSMNTDCLPSARDWGAPVALVLWHEWRFNTAGGEGIFLRTQGRAPNRTFTISWQGQFNVSANAPANAQVTFREGSQTMLFTYGESVYQNLAQIGVQSRLKTSYTERYCNNHGVYPTNGDRLRIVHVD